MIKKPKFLNEWKSKIGANWLTLWHKHDNNYFWVLLMEQPLPIWSSHITFLSLAIFRFFNQKKLERYLRFD